MYILPLSWDVATFGTLHFRPGGTWVHTAVFRYHLVTEWARHQETPLPSFRTAVPFGDKTFKFLSYTTLKITHPLGRISDQALHKTWGRTHNENGRFG